MATPRKKEFQASIAINLWVDVYMKADSLEDALQKAKEITVDKIIEAAQTQGVIDCGKPKITGVYTLEDWEK